MERTEAIGMVGELSFTIHAIENGFTVLYPEGVHGYDCVVERNGKFTRVQIKTTSVIDDKRRYSWNVNGAHKDADVFALHVKNTDIFFLISANDLKNIKSKYKIRLNDINNKYLNNWDIFN